MIKKTDWDYISENKLKYLKNIIGKKIFFEKKNFLPCGGHWLYFNENNFEQELGIDGHPKRGKFFPLLRGYKRMFAGSQIFFKKDILIGDRIKKTTELGICNKKISGKNNLYFFEVINKYVRNKEIVLKELQTIVFLKSKKKHSHSKKEKISLSDLTLLKKKKFKYDNIDLFKYSSLTNNSHRIHYDRDYTVKYEGHKNLLVHGPLIATTVLNEISVATKKKIKEFDFSLLAPICVNELASIKIYSLNKLNTNLVINIFKKNSILAFKAKAIIEN